MSRCISVRTTADRSYRRWCTLAAIAILATTIGTATGVGTATAALPVIVETLDAKKLTGELVSLDAQSLVLDTAGGREKLPTSGILSLKPGQAAQPATNPKPTCRVELVDGSQIAAVGYQVKSGKARIEAIGTAAIELSTKSIHWVRFLADDRNDKLARDWSQIATGKTASDLLVVRKQGALDYLEGVLGDVDDESVRFELEKELIPVKRPKIEGLIYYHASGDDLPEPMAEAVDRGGSRFEVQSIVLAGDQLTLTTPAGLKFSQPLSNLERLDFSSVNTQYLSGLDPASFQYASYFTPRAELPVLSESNKPRRDIGFDGLPLKLEGKAYTKGLSLHSRSEVGYRLPGKFRRFKALAGIDDSVRPGGDLQLEIRGDQKLLWEGRIRGSDAAQPLDLDITGVKRLDIVVDFGADLDIGDLLDLCEARVTK